MTIDPVVELRWKRTPSGDTVLTPEADAGGAATSTLPTMSEMSAVRAVHARLRSEVNIGVLCERGGDSRRYSTTGTSETTASEKLQAVTLTAS
jgi:hypothetical protein